MYYEIEPELQDGRRALPTTQELFAGVPVQQVANPNEISWYGTSISPLRGAFGLVREGEKLGKLVGDFVRVTNTDNRASVIVYIIGEWPDLDTPIALTRRAYAAIELLALTPSIGYVETIQ